jgi:hypothetical protein
MPFLVNPLLDCKACPYGKCISYIREQSKKMKDRDTQYRLSQKASMACTYDEAIPGFDPHGWGSLALRDLVDQCIHNGIQAGNYIEREMPDYFGKSVESNFFLTSAQKGKVRGDIFEFLVRAILWNSAICISREYSELLPSETQDIFLYNSSEFYAAITLGDGYDLKKLFTQNASQELAAFERSLESKNTSFCYSTPDLVVVKIRDSRTRDLFLNPIKNLSIATQDALISAKKILEGTVEPGDVHLAAGIKTSIRSDRLYQLLFEANAWKAIWRTVYELSPPGYYSLIGQSYGADPRKLNSVEFTSLTTNLESVEKAIDSLIYISTPIDIMRWYSSTFHF